MKHRSLTFVATLAGLAGPAHAQKQIAPGLWENTVTVKTQPGGQFDGAMSQMQEQLSKLTPEQRKKVEEMMASRGAPGGAAMGAGMSAMAGKPTTVKVCITPEQAARDEMPQNQGRCTQTSKERSGNTLKFKFSCAGERPVTGEGEYTFASDKVHTGHVVVSMMVKGQPERLEMQHDGRWLGADCGDVKPRAAPPAKK